MLGDGGGNVAYEVVLCGEDAGTDQGDADGHFNGLFPFLSLFGVVVDMDKVRSVYT
jgi:hypothetical protein